MAMRHSRRHRRRSDDGPKRSCLRDLHLRLDRPAQRGRDRTSRGRQHAGVDAGRPGLSASDRMLAITTLTFDIAALEIFLPLVCGASVVIAPSETAGDGVALASLIAAIRRERDAGDARDLAHLVERGWGGAPRLEDLVRRRDLTHRTRERGAGPMRHALEHVRADGNDGVVGGLRSKSWWAGRDRAADRQYDGFISGRLASWFRWAFPASFISAAPGLPGDIGRGRNSPLNASSRILSRRHRMQNVSHR